MSSQITVNDFKWIKGENDQEYIGLLLDTLDRQKKITAKAIARVKELSKQNSPSQPGIQPDVPDKNVGKWINDKCSKCGYGVEPWNNTPYCPRCGAKMIDG